jgi:hypothetical protein
MANQPPPVPVGTGRQALANIGLDRLQGMPPNNRYEVWVRGNLPVYVPYAGPPPDTSHFDGEAFQAILTGG